MTQRTATDSVQRHRLHLLGALAGSATLGLIGCSTTSSPTSSAPAKPSPATQPQFNARQAMKPASQRRYSTGPLTGSYANRQDVMAQIPDMARRLDLPEDYVRNAIGNANFIESIPRLIMPGAPGGRRNWRVYRSRFIDNVRIRAGMQWWDENAADLARAERVYGVPAKYIVGIVGIETIYGRNTGNFRIVDALSTLSFDFPSAHPRAASRQKFFRDELEQYLQLTWNNNDDPMSLRGSYAGAMGLPQFMPSSWAKHGVDFDGDNHIDLFASPADVIGSVANYFKQYGWVPGVEPGFNVTFDPSRLQLETLLAPDIVPSFTKEQFQALGATVPNLPANFNRKLALIELENGTAASSYYAGTDNFYVITRYNNSSYYAQSVIDLANEVEHARSRR